MEEIQAACGFNVFRTVKEESERLKSAATFSFGSGIKAGTSWRIRKTQTFYFCSLQVSWERARSQWAFSTVCKRLKAACHRLKPCWQGRNDQSVQHLLAQSERKLGVCSDLALEKAIDIAGSHEIAQAQLKTLAGGNNGPLEQNVDSIKRHSSNNILERAPK